MLLIHEFIVFSISVHLQFTRLYFSQHLEQTKLPGQTVTSVLTNYTTAGDA